MHASLCVIYDFCLEIRKVFRIEKCECTFKSKYYHRYFQMRKLCSVLSALNVNFPHQSIQAEKYFHLD